MAALMSRFRAGDLVEVRSKEEIFATLDENGELQSLPFMPEMLRFCGQRFEVFASAHKTCDTINQTGCRRMNTTVHLKELRCDGSAHGGCQTNCLFFWKDDWLRPAGGERAEPMRTGSVQRAVDEQLLLDRTIKPGDDPSGPHLRMSGNTLV